MSGSMSKAISEVKVVTEKKHWWCRKGQCVKGRIYEICFFAIPFIRFCLTLSSAYQRHLLRMQNYLKFTYVGN